MVQFIDTLRDSVQAPWFSRISSQGMLPALLSMDKAGFQALDCMTAIQFEVSVKYLKKNPGCASAPSEQERPSSIQISTAQFSLDAE